MQLSILIHKSKETKNITFNAKEVFPMWQRLMFNITGLGSIVHAIENDVQTLIDDLHNDYCIYPFRER